MSHTSLSVAIIAGVRPQFIKVAALQQGIDEFNRTSSSRIHAEYIHSGQHYDDDLSGRLIRELGIKFDYQLTHQNHDPNDMFSNMLLQISQILDKFESLPRWVIVFGDATTTLAGALAAARRSIPVVHIEAGVRSGDLRTIEEVHRRVVSHISSVHFCSTKSGVENLRAENITENVFWTGDLSYAYFMEYAAKQPNGIAPHRVGDYIFVTIHKPVNLNSRITMENLVTTLSQSHRQVVFVTHPRCRVRLMELGLYGTNGITFLDPLPYGRMISAMKGCAFILTDSGGVQREACYLRKRCLVRRDTLGWSDLISAGINRLVGIDQRSIKEGLDWIESVLATADYQYLSGFEREKACDFALRKLVELA